MGKGVRGVGAARVARVARGVEARHTYTHAHTTTRGLGDGGEGGEGGDLWPECITGSD